ncbi:MAG: hypothetical protein LUE27_10370, partial [Clostridia bacterium]|nr:hypothetical protein [Clostridia bacterium]
ISIKVKVTSDIVESVSAAAIAGKDETYYSFWSPYAVAIDNDPESANFGRILVTESQTTSYAKTTYHSSPANGGIGVGIYAFDPLMQPIANSQGTYGFTAGIEMEESGAYYPNGASAIYDFKRLKYSDDGRLFLSRVSTNASGLWELDPNDLESGATPVFEGTIDTETGLITDASGNFVAGPATAMDVYGSGDDLKIAIVSCQDGYELSAPSHRVDVYNLGSATTWSEAPTIADLGSKYWVNSAIINTLFDADGEGLTIGQYRGTPSDAEPAYVHYDLTTLEEGYKDITTVAGGAGMAWNTDKSLFALSTAAGQVTVYSVADDGEGNLSYTKLCDVATGLGTNSNAIAFDVANNLYICSNSGEKFSTFALPRESGDVTVAAASQYDFTTPEAPELVEKNAYAYDISVATDDENATVKYRLNATATAVEVQAYDGDDVVYTVAGTMDAGLNSVKVPFSELPEGTEISIKVKVTSDVVDAVSVAAIADNDNTYYKFYCPYGLAVNNDPESDSFGRVFVTETQTNTYTQSGYHSSIPDNGGNGIGVGIYAFDPLMQPILNADGGYGFSGGIEKEEASAVYPTSTTNVYDFKRLAISADGRLFLSRASTRGVSLWEFDPSDLDADATPVFEGNLDETTGYLTDDDGNFIAGPATAMDVYGSGDDLKVAIVSCKDGYELSAASHRVDVYNLGSESTWSEAPSISDIGGEYWINSAMINVKFDPDGNGFFVGQYRGTPTDAEPAYVHFKLDENSATENYKDITTVAQTAGMAWNSDGTRMAMAIANATVGIYKVTFDEEGVPTFDLETSFATGLGGNTNAIAWDAADNLYICSNSGEKLSTFVVPRESGDVIVPAASYYAFVTPASEPTELLFSFVASEDAETGISIEGDSEGIIVAVDYGDGNDPVTFSSESNTVTIDPAAAGNTVTVYGVDPAAIVSIDATGLGLSDIELSDGLENLFFLSIADNALTFSTLPIVDTDQVVYTYAPQADIEVSVQDGGEYNSPCVIDLSSEADINGTATVFAWYTSDDVALVEGEDYTIEDGVTTFTGVATDVYCVLTNDLFPDLTLKTVTVEVDKVESIAADGSAVVSVIPGEILISGEFDNAVIYNTAGIAVVAKAGSDNKVQAGIYIVVVDGNVTKVAVK